MTLLNTWNIKMHDSFQGNLIWLWSTILDKSMYMCVYVLINL